MKREIQNKNLTFIILHSSGTSMGGRGKHNFSHMEQLITLVPCDLTPWKNLALYFFFFLILTTASYSQLLILICTHAQAHTHAHTHKSRNFYIEK